MLVTVKLMNVRLLGNIYHFRMSVPEELQVHYGRKEHSESLDTADELEANKKSAVLTARYKAEHRKLRATIRKQPASSIPKGDGTKKSTVDLSAVEYQLSQLVGFRIAP